MIIPLPVTRRRRLYVRVQRVNEFRELQDRRRDLVVTAEAIMTRKSSYPDHGDDPGHRRVGRRLRHRGDGHRTILEQYQDRVVIAELDTNVSVSGMVDIVLYDSFARPDSPLRRHRAAGPP